MSAEQSAEEVERGPDDEAAAAGMVDERVGEQLQTTHAADPFTLAAIWLGRTFDSLDKAPHSGSVRDKIAFAHAAAAYGHALAARDQLVIMMRAEKRLLDAQAAAEAAREAQQERSASGLVVPR